MGHRLRRCLLSVPGSNEKMLLKAASLDVDVVIIDLEDGVAPQEKQRARALTAEVLASTDFKAPTVSVRINDLASSHCYQDVLALFDHSEPSVRQADTIILPKTQSGADILFLCRLLHQIESRHGTQRPVGIEALIEDATGMLAVEAVACTHERLESLVFGMGDFAASQGISTTAIGHQGHYTADLWHYPRYKLIMAARAENLEPIDGPFANFRDSEGLSDDLTAAKTLGMVGKWAIHPDQIAAITAAFTPSQEAIEIARRQRSAFDEAIANGQGAVSVDGTMVDQASIKLLAPLLKKAELLGL